MGKSLIVGAIPDHFMTTIAKKRQLCRHMRLEQMATASTKEIFFRVPNLICSELVHIIWRAQVS